MQRTRLIAALASAAVSIAAVAPATASAQTTMAPTPGTVVGPTAAPATPAPMMSVPAMSKPPNGAGGAMIVPGMPALDARGLRARRRTSTGYTLSGQALVKDACQGARFEPARLTIYPPQFNLVQFRRLIGALCIPRVVWVTAQPRTNASMKPPAYITVHTQKRTLQVPIR